VAREGQALSETACKSWDSSEASALAWHETPAREAEVELALEASPFGEAGHSLAVSAWRQQWESLVRSWPRLAISSAATDARSRRAARRHLSGAAARGLPTAFCKAPSSTHLRHSNRRAWLRSRSNTGAARVRPSQAAQDRACEEESVHPSKPWRAVASEASRGSQAPHHQGLASDLLPLLPEKPTPQ